ncbi:nicotinate-nucleotide--dimethylbenzimidazole phosphoribosyltransferase [Notoacmeibacter sp. MSK16QG-6]|uniref:nicotinate-nucleotide--dimethylbenzimidazole phosphoribosyltransferase n=1 Tax=Notoacmeibacter sp. MSK16QG-6 TaxID=2957982 RepID=UPI0020A16A8B|nr:nicotinate-nucleotide--dimethylbenzimidazole phosphoribosyltransferase [Notoacmeibacter sp. MSK16QG-6]MCP1199493.1 nicotinate-nucleotide--dimethylbenzimidazole phosphoribosyltransferase [Notoacmeibacter sp. MSK16QG-6]
MASGLPFDDFRNLLTMLPPPDHAAGETVTNALKAKYADAGLGRLGEIASWYAKWSGRALQPVVRPLCAVFAGNHGHASAHDTPWDMSRTQAAVDLAAAGGSPVNGVCVAQDVGLRILDLALDHPTADMRAEASLDERGCAATMAFGMEAMAGGVDLVAVGAMGEGSEASSVALLTAMLGEPADVFLGEATDELSEVRAETVKTALRCHKGHLSDPFEALRRLGGREHAAMAGLLLAARMENVPVVISGRAALAVVAVLHKANAMTVGHCILADPGHRPGVSLATRRFGMTTLPDYGLDTDDGASAALGAGIVKTAVNTCSVVTQPDRAE